MTPAREPRDRREIRLLAIDPSARSFADRHFAELAQLLCRGDLLVVNDAATLPASLSMDGGELRLVSMHEDGSWRAVLMGPGDWRTPTEHRAAPARFEAGSRLRIGTSLEARVEEVSSLSPRLVTVRFDRKDAELWQALYASGTPIQYAHLSQPLDLWSVQTSYASRPWAVEAPSAGLPLGWDLLRELRAAGVGLARLTHASGLSATGDPAIDAALPLPERYEIPESTAVAVAETRAARRRVVAVGTTVVRALEGSVHRHGEVRPGAGVTDLRIGPGFVPRVVDGLVTGMHTPAESHYSLLGAFVPGDLLEASFRHALAAGYLGHEFGDATLVLQP
ncbi:MAG TPA: S-adenosylmethionine:tRNA ribosyltransferase-isomerase [Polyangiaceae bacterium]|nr:S-adenosylmethionine:tRNA ribosyltransferase-isomerase [Polyangiaceae bacterium]